MEVWSKNYIHVIFDLQILLPQNCDIAHPCATAAAEAWRYTYE